MIESRSAVVRPNFFVIGAHKAGTTSFCQLLASHPDVFMSSPKEPGFFARADRMARRLDWYESLFATAEGKAAVGEGSTTYSQCGVYPGTAGRIKDYCAEASIIYLVRHPLRRIESGWMQYRSQGRTDVPAEFATAVREVPQLLDASRYWRQICQYRALFQRVLLLFFEDFASDPRSVLQAAFSFLRIDPMFILRHGDSRRNESAGKRDPGRLVRLTTRISGNSDLRWLKRLSRGPLGRGPLRRPLRALFGRVLTKPIARPHWDPETRSWVIRELVDDTTELLAAYGKAASYWELA
jgi:hypothetical protein